MTGVGPRMVVAVAAVVASTSVAASAATEEQRYFELEPLLPLPKVNLSVSVKSQFTKNRHIHRWLRALARSRLTFPGYILSLGLAVSVFFVPARQGRMLSVVEFLVRLPGVLVALGNLRFEMVAVLAKTYDVWFFGVVSTVVSAVLALLLGDARALVMVSSWLSFVVNIYGDASVLRLRPIWIASLLTMVGYAAMACAVTIEITEELRPFDLLRINGHALPAVAVVRDGFVTMILAIARNVACKYTHARYMDKIATGRTLFRCASFRCRLQLREATYHTTRQDSAILSRHVCSLTGSHRNPASSNTNTQLRYEPALHLIDVHKTLLPMPWLWRLGDDEMSSAGHFVRGVGIAGFVLTNLFYAISIVWDDAAQQRVQLPIIVVVVSASTCFVLGTGAALQRELLRAVVTSFDFLFIFIETAIVHVALADILDWRPTTVITLFADLQWCAWILCLDAMTPPVRRRLGLSHRLVAWTGPLLLVVLTTVVIVVFVARPPETINDRVVFSFQFGHHAVEIRSITLYFSSVTTISTWAIRFMWRLWKAGDAELAVLDGTVVYTNRVPGRAAAISPATLHGIRSTTPNSPPAIVPVG